MRLSSRRVLAEAAGVTIIIRALAVIGDHIVRVRELTAQAAGYQQQLLAERDARNSDVRGLNATVAHANAHIDHLTRSISDANKAVQVQHDRLIKIQDRLAWGVGGLRTIQTTIDAGSTRTASAALDCVSQALREQLGEQRVVPTVPLSSLAGGEQAVARANRNAGDRGRLALHQISDEHPDAYFSSGAQPEGTITTAITTAEVKSLQEKL